MEILLFRDWTAVVGSTPCGGRSRRDRCSDRERRIKCPCADRTAIAPGSHPELSRTRQSDNGDHVVYGARSQGINLRWLKDLRRIESQTGVGSLHDATVTMTAQPVVQGFVPFLGRFGGGVDFNAVLTKVANPSNGVPLAFVKPGFSTLHAPQPEAADLVPRLRDHECEQRLPQHPVAAALKASHR
jgi:hypothetical protein